MGKKIEDMSEDELYRKSGKAYDKAMPEADTTYGNLSRKAVGAAMAVPGAVVGGAYMGLHPDSPGVIESAKYGAKKMYHGIAGNKKEEAEAEKDFEAATKRAQSHQRKSNTGENTNPAGDSYKRGGKVSSASKRADGIAQRGKTRGTMIMCGGGYMKGK